MPHLSFNSTPTYKLGIIMLPSLCRRKLMMQNSLREESLLHAGILLYGSRLEIATGIKVKHSHWEVIYTGENSVSLGSYQWYFARMNSLGRGRNTFYVSAVPGRSQIHHQ